jgi:hypothetical protein
MSFLATGESASSPGPDSHAAITGIQARWTALAHHAVPLLFCMALWVFCHPYLGIVGDSRVYIGRILADLDPAGVGRDVMFVNDGQSGFTLFPLLARGLVAHLGAGRAAELIGAIGCFCWFAAALALAMRLNAGRGVWLILAIVCALPSSYGAQAFFAAETSALPRPFAEAAVLAALAASLGRRRALAVALMALGLLIHPIMALPGAAVLAVMELRACTIIIAGLLLIAACVALGLAGVSVFDRLFIKVDDEWLGMLLQLSPHLFTTQWTSKDFGILTIAATTLVIAADLLRGPRRMMFGVLIAGLGGVIASAVLADFWLSLLAIQVQSWRSTWLMVVIAHYAYALCVLLLWNREFPVGRGQNRATLALLSLGCFLSPDLGLAVPISAAALTLHFGRFSKPVAPPIVFAACAAAAGLILYFYCQALENFFRFTAALPAEWTTAIVFGLHSDVFALPLCAMAILWFHVARRASVPMSVGIAAGSGALVLAVLLGASRPQAAIDLEMLRNPPEFAEILHGNPGEVLWVDGKSEGWHVLGRPQWLSTQQVVSIVFSRPLAMAWRERAQFLLDNRLIPSNAFEPWNGVEESAILNVTRQALDHVCARDDAPAAVVFPLEKGTPLPSDISAAVWNLPHIRYVMDFNSKNVWHHVDRYAAVSCAAGIPLLRH